MTDSYNCANCNTPVFMHTGRVKTVKTFYVLCDDCLNEGFEKDYKEELKKRAKENDKEMSVLSKD